MEGTGHAFPAMRDLRGQKLADGDYTQWQENGRLHVDINYEFGHGRRVEEKSVFQQKPEFVQEEWHWREWRDGRLYRKFEVDLKSGKAMAQKNEEQKPHIWSEDVKIEPGRTFAGYGFTLAIKGLREHLIKGEKVELQTVGFTPKPRMVAVEISYGGLDQNADFWPDA